MKIICNILLIVGFFGVLMVLFSARGQANHNNRGACLGIYGTVYSKGNWPADMNVSVSCEGALHPLHSPPECPGDSATRLGPNSRFDLGYCSCPAYEADGCLKIHGLAQGCTAKFNAGHCGTTGQTIDASFTVTCQPQVSACTPGQNCSGGNVCCGDNILCQMCNTGLVNSDGSCQQGLVEKAVCDAGEMCDTQINQCVVSSEISPLSTSSAVTEPGNQIFGDPVISTTQPQFICNSSCSGGSSCGDGACFMGLCRNSECFMNDSCVCSGATQ